MVNQGLVRAVNPNLTDLNQLCQVLVDVPAGQDRQRVCCQAIAEYPLYLPDKRFTTSNVRLKYGLQYD